MQPPRGGPADPCDPAASSGPLALRRLDRLWRPGQLQRQTPLVRRRGRTAGYGPVVHDRDHGATFPVATTQAAGPGRRTDRRRARRTDKYRRTRRTPAAPARRCRGTVGEKSCSSVEIRCPDPRETERIRTRSPRSPRRAPPETSKRSTAARRTTPAALTPTSGSRVLDLIRWRRCRAPSRARLPTSASSAFLPLK